MNQVGLEGERLRLHTLSGSSSVEWTQGSFVAQKQPLTWYKVSILNITRSENFNVTWSIVVLYKINH